jgi:hypothetical protein
MWRSPINGFRAETKLRDQNAVDDDRTTRTHLFGITRFKMTWTGQKRNGYVQGLFTYYTVRINTFCVTLNEKYAAVIKKMRSCKHYL